MRNVLRRTPGVLLGLRSKGARHLSGQPVGITLSWADADLREREPVSLTPALFVVLQVGWSGPWCGNLVVRAAELFRARYPGCEVEIREVRSATPSAACGPAPSTYR